MPMTTPAAPRGQGRRQPAAVGDASCSQNGDAQRIHGQRDQDHRGEPQFTDVTTSLIAENDHRVGPQPLGRPGVADADAFVHHLHPARIQPGIEGPPEDGVRWSPRSGPLLPE